LGNTQPFTEKKWGQLKSRLEQLHEYVIFNTWIKPLEFVQHDAPSGILYLQVPDDFKKSVLEDRYLFDIRQQAEEIHDGISKISLLLPDDVARLRGVTDGSDGAASRSDLSNENLVNPLKTFETFVEGDNSRFAYAAALNVAESAERPNQGFNPLFIYGDSGLGKTHLMNAITNFVFSHYPKLKVLYISSETFTNEFVSASMNKNMNAFKAKYRNIDMLMIDDIQFIEQKDKTIEEVFHTYNTLYGMGKQLVFSSDRPPRDLLGLDERLKGRLGSGLIVDLKPPAFEIKVAILRNKAKLENIELTDGLIEVIDIIADKVNTNVREMEGAFNRVVAFSTLSGQPVTKSMAKQALRDIISSGDIVPTIDSIKKEVARFYDIKVADMDSSNRARQISTPRQVAMYFCREMTSSSLPKIGTSFSRDHTTVMHAHQKIAATIRENPSFADTMVEIEENIRNA
jgi:chromosomal replication initiator protein